MMFTFTDKNGYQVDLYFTKEAHIPCKHVLTLIKKEDKWLCAVHHRRGVEFPGGKVEPGETLEQAAAREVLEETGVRVKNLQWFAFYVVHDEPKFCKTVFIADVAKEEETHFDYETIGKLWLSEDEIFDGRTISFYMQDAGMQKIMEEVKKRDTRG